MPVFFFEETAKALPQFLLDGENKNTSVWSSFHSSRPTLEHRPNN
jgi:hypothetical protein